MEPKDVKLGRISDLKNSPFFDESPLRSLQERRAADSERAENVEALLTQILAELVEIKGILLSQRDATAAEAGTDQSE